VRHPAQIGLLSKMMAHSLRMNVAALLALNGVGVDVAGQLLVTAGGPNAAPPKACPRKRTSATSSA